MKEEAAAKELEHLLREALNTGLDSPRGGTPLIQLKTVPLQVQHIPKLKKAAPAPLPKPLPASVPAVDIEPSPNSEGPNLADRLAPESVPPPKAAKVKVKAKAKAKPQSSSSKKTSTSKVALGIMGIFVLGAIGGAVWLARDRHAVSLANVATAAQQPAAQPTTAAATTAAEGAVGIAVASRPVQAPDSKPAVVATATITDVAPAPPPPATFTSTSVAAAPPATAATPVAKTAQPVAAAEKPAPSAKPVSTHHSSKPPAEPKPEKTAAAEKPEKPAPPPPAASPASVDALLQQQLKGAIP